MHDVPRPYSIEARGPWQWAHVTVRMRSGGATLVVEAVAHDTLWCPTNRHTFDRVFTPKSSQEEVYKYVAQPLVQDALNGFNWCGCGGALFVFGKAAHCGSHTHTSLAALCLHTVKRGLERRTP